MVNAFRPVKVDSTRIVSIAVTRTFIIQPLLGRNYNLICSILGKKVLTFSLKREVITYQLIQQLIINMFVQSLILH